MTSSKAKAEPGNFNIMSPEEFLAVYVYMVFVSKVSSSEVTIAFTNVKISSAVK